MNVRSAAVLLIVAALALTACSTAEPAVSQSSSSTAPPSSPSTSSPSSSTSTQPAASPSAASPSTASPQPVVVDELGRGGQELPVDVDVAGPNQVVFRKITLKPGAGTGLHCHDGQLIAVVEKGVFTHYAPVYPGGVHTYVAGDSLVEGASYVHEGKNQGTTDVVLLVTYVIRAGDPLAETDLSKCGH